jgi:hypothetical protein
MDGEKRAAVTLSASGLFAGNTRGSEPGGTLLEKLLIVIASSEEGLEVGGPIGLYACWPGNAILEGREFAITDQIEDVEIDLRENAAELFVGEFSGGNAIKIGKVHGCRRLRTSGRSDHSGTASS